MQFSPYDCKLYGSAFHCVIIIIIIIIIIIVICDFHLICVVHKTSIWR